MTGSAAFTEDEWTTIRMAPMSAGMIVVTAQSGGTFRETFSMGKAYAHAREQHGASELLDAVVSAKPQVDRPHVQSVEELRAASLQRVRDAVALVEAKATPEELADYRGFVIALSTRVAEAHREGDGADAVGEGERAAIGEIRAALGAPAA